MSERKPGGFAMPEAQADACECPACRSPFTNGRKHAPHRPSRAPGLMYFDFDAGKVRIEPTPVPA